jgi:DNA (cytosine-5)-methyltransferase 1
MLTHFSLFTGGVNAFGIASKWAGFKEVGFCEIDKYCQALLNKNWPGIPIWSDVRNVTNESIQGYGIGKIKLLTASPECQPISRAGKQLGKDDDRYLWNETLTVVSEIRPDWFIAENPVEFANVGLDDAFDYLESQGYTTGAFVIPAVSVFASHRRDRLFMVAYSGKKRLERLHETRYRKYLQRLEEIIHRYQWETTPRVFRRGNEITNRVDRTKVIGNSFDPRQVYPII